MSLSTNSFNRKEKTADLIKYHADKMKANNIENPIFIPKCAYQPHGLEGLHLGFFDSELKKGLDIYTEFVSIDLEPEDEERNLYKLRGNPHYEEEYESAQPIKVGGGVRYFVPVSELIKIDFPERQSWQEEAVFPNFDNMMDPENDEPLARMTIKDLAAIMLKKPVSDKKWLNKIIEK